MGNFSEQTMRTLRGYLSDDHYLILNGLRFGFRLSRFLSVFGLGLALAFEGIELIRGCGSLSPRTLRKSPWGGWYFKEEDYFYTSSEVVWADVNFAQDYVILRTSWAEDFPELSPNFTLSSDGLLKERVVSAIRASKLGVQAQGEIMREISSRMVSRLPQRQNIRQAKDIVFRLRPIVGEDIDAVLQLVSQPVLPSHGDLFLGNVLVQRTNQSANPKIIDWEIGQVGSYPWWFDIVTVNFVSVLQGHWQKTPLSWRRANLEYLKSNLSHGLALLGYANFFEKEKDETLIQSFSAIQVLSKLERSRLECETTTMTASQAREHYITSVGSLMEFFASD